MFNLNCSTKNVQLKNVRQKNFRLKNVRKQKIYNNIFEQVCLATNFSTKVVEKRTFDKKIFYYDNNFNAQQKIVDKTCSTKEC